MPTARHPDSLISNTSPCSKPSAVVMMHAVKPLPKTGVMKAMRRTGASSSNVMTSMPLTSPHPTTPTMISPSPQPKPARWFSVKNPSGAIQRKASKWSTPSKKPECLTSSGITTALFPPSPWPKTSSIVANSAASSTTAPISSKTGPLMPSSPRVAKACGDSMLMPLAVESPVTY